MKIKMQNKIEEELSPLFVNFIGTWTWHAGLEVYIWWMSNGH